MTERQIDDIAEDNDPAGAADDDFDKLKAMKKKKTRIPLRNSR